MENQKPKILLIEDDEFLRTLVIKRLENDGFSTAVAIDGESGLATMTDTKPDLVLLDLLLPGVNGFEVLGKINQDENLRRIPVVVFSNLGQREDIEKALSLGAADYLIKANFTLDDLVVKIKQRLG